ncbi:hypothetical protein DYB32_000129 [Aphanomyces invadans]|uniref:tRNA-dihydrouridine(16/17) synthase [NAD(P)(+)] n=1 Tax=Aphanomyces invadans TaxID=157072 RepID=A0A3R6VUG4_9STRA|nr:hypothetical protein DYB32_000129 [Aphanomyces invadans]
MSHTKALSGLRRVLLTPLQSMATYATNATTTYTSSSPSVRELAIERGWKLYNDLNQPKRIVAPMVDQSELAFRMLTRKYGADLCYTPMFHARMFQEDATYRETAWQVEPTDRPLFVQFCGNNPDTVLHAARYVESHCDAIDLNLGCPQGIAKKGRYGAFLMHEPEVVRSIVSKLSSNLSVPVTCKIRLLPKYEDTLAFCNMLIDAGCCWLVVHGRTKEMNKHLVRECDWDSIARLKKALPIPVFANGGIETDDDVVRCMLETGVNGVMSSEGILERPALFANDRDKHGVPIRQYLQLAKTFPPPEKFLRAHLFKILFQELKVHTDLREQIGLAQTHDVLWAITKELKARLDAAAPVPSSVEGSWYRRHRKLQNKADTKPAMEKCDDSGFADFSMLFG